VNERFDGKRRVRAFDGRWQRAEIGFDALNGRPSPRATNAGVWRS